MRNLKFNLTLTLVIASFSLAFSQGVAINNDGSSANGSAMLDVKSTDAGLLIPRMTQAQRNAISSPATGLMIYQTDNTAGFYYYDGSSWSWLYSGDVPSVPGNVEHWIRPSAANYIHPEHNSNIRVHDATETYGMFYDGNSNQYGIYSQTSSATSPTSAVVGFSNVSGNNTYGYLGYNGTYTAPTTGFGSVYGSGVYGIVDDPGRTAGFFRSTGSAEYAANIAYSDVWIPGFFYGDHIDASFSARPSVYGYMNTAVDVGGIQSAIKGFAEYTNTGNSGYTVGGSFNADGNTQDAIGVLASASSSANSYGVYASAEGTGIYGIGDNNGVVGETTDPALYYGIYANGDLGASGTKYFVIDHPLDPENKILKHACIESNEILNEYRGNITLNENGEAIVSLPDYFESINMNYSYHLTPIGAPAPNLYIKQEIRNNQFVVAGGSPNMKVSWTVKAERNDKYLQTYPEKRIVEIDKADDKKGKYLDYRIYNQSRKDSYMNIKPLPSCDIKKEKESQKKQ